MARDGPRRHDRGMRAPWLQPARRLARRRARARRPDEPVPPRGPALGRRQRPARGSRATARRARDEPRRRPGWRAPVPVELPHLATGSRPTSVPRGGPWNPTAPTGAAVTAPPACGSPPILVEHVEWLRATSRSADPAIAARAPAPYWTSARPPSRTTSRATCWARTPGATRSRCGPSRDAPGPSPACAAWSRPSRHGTRPARPGPAASSRAGHSRSSTSRWHPPRPTSPPRPPASARASRWSRRRSSGSRRSATATGGGVTRGRVRTC